MILLSPTPDGIAQAARVIHGGGIVACPTETVYGLSADPFSDAVLERLFAAKGRPKGNPVLLIIGELNQLARVVDTVSPAAEACIRRFWPGPLSLVLPARKGLPEILTAGGDTICVRQPDCMTARALCLAADMPLTSTSANVSGAIPVRHLADLDLPGVELGLDAGELAPSLPSTIYDPARGVVLREGAIATALLQG